jgi:agmatinase
MAAGQGTGPPRSWPPAISLSFMTKNWRASRTPRFGVATRVPTEIAADQAAALDQIEAEVSAVLEDGRFPLVLGGEHALTAGAIRPFVAGGEPITILQFDAHADLRDGYLGEHYSHASAMRRALDLPGVSVISVGIRAISKAEAEFYDANRDRITIHWAKDMDRWSIDEIVAPLAGKRVYVSFDIDGLDGAIMPATGTPTPGGLGYWQALAIMRAAARAGTIVGGDVVELAPIDGLHVCDYTAAAIAYKLMSYALLERSS